MEEAVVLIRKVWCQLFRVVGPQKQQGETGRTRESDMAGERGCPGIGQKGLHGSAGTAVVFETHAAESVFQQGRPFPADREVPILP